MTVLAHKIRLDPNNVQRTWLTRAAGTARFVYNWGLARWQEMYAAGEKPSRLKLNAELNRRKADEFPWMYKVPWKVANAALADLDKAFQAFFRRVKLGEKPGYPRFKKKAKTRNTFAIEGRALKFDSRRVRIPKLGWIRMYEAVRFPGKILSARFTESAGHWYISVQVEVDESRWAYPHRCKTQAVVGMDLGLRDLAVLSDGSRIAAPRVLRRYEARLQRLGRELSRRTRGSANWRKTKAKIARLHARIADVRHAVTHELTATLVREYRWIGIEDLNVAGMARSRLAKSVYDAAPAEVRRQLAYKAPLAGSDVVIVDRWFPSSKTCSACGHVLDTLLLSTRQWTCPECGAVHDRDVNAAVNLRNLAAAHAATACGEESAGVHRDTKLASAKQESSSYVNAG